MISLKKLLRLFNQSDAEVKSITMWSRAFFRAWLSEI